MDVSGFEPLALEVRQKFVEGDKLSGCGIQVRFISSGKMGKDSIYLDASAFELFNERRDMVRSHTEPSHASFHLYMGMQRAAMNIDVIKVILRQFGVKQSDGDVIFDHFRDFGGRCKAEHQYLAGNARAAQGERFFDARHADPRCAAGNSRLGGRTGAMPVAVGFDYSHHLCSSDFTDQGGIILDSFKVNLKPG